MPWTTPETFTAGQTLTAASMNVISGNARMGQPVFTNEAARDAAITAPEEGMTAYLTAPTVPAATGGTTAVPTGVTTIYNGSVWVCVTPVGSYTSTQGTLGVSGYTTSLSTGTTPTVTLVTGTTALVHFGATFYNSLSSATYTSVSVSGASTIAASDDWASLTGSAAGFYFQVSFVMTGLTTGTNTFSLSHKVNGGTGTFYNRRIIVQGIA